MIFDGRKRTTIKPSQLEKFFTSYQLNHQPTTEASCPLCNINLAKERIHYNDEEILIADTKEKKGHRKRVMVITKKHGIQHPKQLLNKAVQQLITEGKELFNSDFILLSDKFSSIRYHWHIVASDLDPNSDDYQQIMETPYILIPNNRS